MDYRRICDCRYVVSGFKTTPPMAATLSTPAMWLDIRDDREGSLLRVHARCAGGVQACRFGHVGVQQVGRLETHAEKLLYSRAAGHPQPCRSMPGLNLEGVRHERAAEAFVADFFGRQRKHPVGCWQASVDPGGAEKHFTLSAD
jgi:hypothetical protein